VQCTFEFWIFRRFDTSNEESFILKCNAPKFGVYCFLGFTQVKTTVPCFEPAEIIVQVFLCLSAFSFQLLQL